MSWDEMKQKRTLVISNSESYEAVMGIPMERGRTLAWTKYNRMNFKEQFCTGQEERGGPTW